MKRFTKTKFFRLLKDEKGGQLSVLAKAYDDFARALLTEKTATMDKTTYNNALCYIRVELVSMTKVSKKKWEHFALP
jgi:hypothetical protein